MHQPHAILNLRRFLSTSAVYAAGDLLTKCARVILIPYYIHALSIPELGTLGVLQAVATACWYLSALGLGYAVRRFYFDYGEDGDRFVAMVWWGRMLVAAVPCALLVVASNATSPMTMPLIPVHLLALAICAGYLRGGFIVLESWFVIREQAFRYRAFTFCQFVTTTALIIYLVSVERMGVAGAIVGELIAHAIWTIMSAVAFGAAVWPTRGLVHWRPLIHYCLPIFPYTMFMWALSWIDRIILQRYVSLRELGLYDAGYMLASVLSVLALAMRATWLPDYFRQARHERASVEYARVATYYFAVMAFATGSAVAFVPEGLWLIASNDFASAIGVVRLVVVGIGFFALFIAFYQPLLYSSRAMAVAAVSGGALLVNIAANFGLIPHYGIWGAALATVLSYVVLAGATLVLTQYEYRIPWDYRTFFQFLVGAAVLGVFCCWLDDAPSLSTVGMKCAATLAYLAWLAILVKRNRGHADEVAAAGVMQPSEDLRGAEVAHES